MPKANSLDRPLSGSIFRVETMFKRHDTAIGIVSQGDSVISFLTNYAQIPITQPQDW